MNPLSKSEWMTPAASGAQAPAGTVQHRTSVSPAVKKYYEEGHDEVGEGRRGERPLMIGMPEVVKTLRGRPT